MLQRPGYAMIKRGREEGSLKDGAFNRDDRTATRPLTKQRLRKSVTKLMIVTWTLFKSYFDFL